MLLNFYDSSTLSPGTREMPASRNIPNSSITAGRRNPCRCLSLTGTGFTGCEKNSIRREAGVSTPAYCQQNERGL